jgi:cyclopropane-fatty-acyl-phospholipid synthase
MSVEAGSDQAFDHPSGPAPARWLPRKLVRTLFSRLKTGRLTIVTPGGQRLASTSVHPGPEAVLVLHRWRTLRRLILGGDVAFAEAYLDGDWSSPDIAALVELAASNDEALRQTISGFSPARLINRIRHALRPNTRRGSRRNIVAHYDLGNAFYRLWLDRGMSYSSGLYRTGRETLEEAQTAKQDRILEVLELQGGESVLEIGCGWGGLAERLAAAGCRVVGLTLSPAQLAHARARIATSGLDGRVELRLQDYREVEGRFDRIVSVEMIEAVGQAYWPAYFRVLRDRLAEGGRAVVQAITIADDRFALYASSPDFIQRYVFPGGMLLSPRIMQEQARGAGLVLRVEELLGPSYARTLREWRGRFLAAWPQIAPQGFDERFRRLWEYYLAYCEGGFRSGATDVGIYRLMPATA